ncbi:MAG TPA: DUF1003 domain-containing protein [Chitinophagaceae bacterium]|nr:DUF1003 domain-containing protein [Chitinophagaceae bacterium]
MTNEKLEQLLASENEQLQKLHAIVLHSIDEEKLLTDKLYQFEEKNLPLPSRIADKVAAFGGSWRFILLFGGILMVWILINLYLLQKPFDPYPFILLNLVLSTIAALQAPVIMMSQNRKEERDRERAISDYMVNLKAEIEIRNLHQKLDLLMADQMKTLFEIQKAQIELMEEIRDRLGSREEHQLNGTAIKPTIRQ